MTLRYKQRLFLFVALLFAVYTAVLLVFEETNSRAARLNSLERILDSYTEIIGASLTHTDSLADTTEGTLSLLPKAVRVTLLDLEGHVLYDNEIPNYHQADNHATRPEVWQALQERNAAVLRTSTSDQRTYLYYAKCIKDYCIRVALPYDSEVASALKTDYSFLLFVLLLFAITLFIINRVTGRFATSIAALRDFAVQGRVSEGVIFPADELGEVGEKLKQNFYELQQQRDTIESERRRLLQHVQGSHEGICFFSVDNHVEYFNGLFLRYLNLLMPEPTGNPEAIFALDLLPKPKPGESFAERNIEVQGRVIAVRVNEFDQGDREIILNDITQYEHTRRLKQEMTSNIAHELRTPVTSIRAYLETLISQELPPEQSRHFIERAFAQSLALSELISDISLLSKIEGAPHLFEHESVNLYQLLEDIKRDAEIELVAAEISFDNKVPQDITLVGNANLLHSIFRNLTDNAIKYAGKGAQITAHLYATDDHNLYLSFADNGEGVPDEGHLSRLFDRFYRVVQGRGRDTGGSGLGLSIVRNAVTHHGGSITVKSPVGGGLEYLITLPFKGSF